MVTSGTGHDRCPSQWRDPDGIPIAVLATPKKFGSPEKVSRPGREFFCVGSRWLMPVCRITPATYGAPLAATTLGRGMDAVRPFPLIQIEWASVAQRHRRIMNGYHSVRIARDLRIGRQLARLPPARSVKLEAGKILRRLSAVAEMIDDGILPAYSELCQGNPTGEPIPI
jgi:hypothetical protein